MCIGTLVLGAVLLAGCSWAVVSLLERGLLRWRQRVGFVASALGALLGVVAVFAAFHAQGDEARVSVVAAPVVVLVAGRPSGLECHDLSGLLATVQERAAAIS